MSRILLTTLNASYAHSAFGLRCLRANMGGLRAETRIVEFTINQLAQDIVDRLLEFDPEILGVGVYLWNVDQTTHVLERLKRVRPDLTIVLGGPEVSFPEDAPPVVELADHVITGEADLAFPELCRQLRAGLTPPRTIHAELPSLNECQLPYAEYSDEDIAHRVIYVEASRGCPFTCEFCLSALDIPVRQFPLPTFLNSLDRLLDRGVRQFKFVDRTFNLNLKVSRAILEFFLERLQPDLFLHFEMIPDRLPAALREVIARFPAGCLQFEVGIQTLNEEVGRRIARRQDRDRVQDNLRFLRTQTGVHVHADLIAGLPGESLESFAAGFDALVAMAPHEIQVGILKRLRGTPLTRHDQEWSMVYSPSPPYDILQNSELSAGTLARLRRFARVWDAIANSGNFVETTPLLWTDGSAFFEFLQFTDWLYEREGRVYGIALKRLAEDVFVYLTEHQRAPAQRVAEFLWRDYCRGGRTDRPGFLRPFELPTAQRQPLANTGQRRQLRHLNADGG